MKKNELKEKTLHILSVIGKIATRNIGLKLLSILFAVILWSYIAYSNTSFTRVKTVTNVPLTVNGLSTLNTAGYAISSELAEALNGVTVDVEAPITSMQQISAGNITVSIDLSTIRKSGTRNMTLHGSSTVGKIVGIHPDKIEVNIESLDTRTVPVNTSVINGSDKYWYYIGKTNPGTITVSGPTSLMQRVASAEITADVTDRTTSFSRAYLITLVDENGEVIDTDNISRSTSSASATVEVYPKKELTIAEDASNITVPDGYHVEDVAFEPKTVTVAGDSDLLSSITALPIEPIVLTDDGTVKTTVKISGLNGFKYISTDQVYVTVNVREDEATRVLQKIGLDAVNVPEGCTAELSHNTVGASVTGAKSRVVGLDGSEARACVDLSGLSEGTYQLDVMMEDIDGLAFDAITPSTVTVTIKKAE